MVKNSQLLYDRGKDKKGSKIMECYKSLNEIQKEEIQAFIDQCSRFDHTCQEVYLGSEFQAYPDMHCFYLEREEEKLTGFLYLYADQKTTAEVSAWVDPQKRRQGIFTRLLGAALQEMKKFSYQKLLFKTEKAFSGAEKILEKYPVTLSHQEFHMLADPQAEAAEKEIPGFSIREAKEEELGTLAEIMEAAFAEEDFEAKEHVKATYRAETALLFTALYREEPVGCVAVDTSGKCNYLYALCIDPKAQGKGYGRKMLCQVIKKLRSCSTKQISLDVDEENQTALPLYESCGFRQASQLVYYAMKL